MKIDTTCAVFITDGTNVIICHPTMSAQFKSWSLPKGCIDAGETEKTAAAREVLEETGLICNPNKLTRIRQFYL